MKCLRRAALWLAPALLFLTACTSVEGPCEVESDSSITLTIHWSGGSIVDAAASPRLQAMGLDGAQVRRFASRTVSRPSRLRADAEAPVEGDTVAIMVEVPESWTIPATAAWQATFTGGGESGTASSSETTTVCDGEFGSVRSGYHRAWFTLDPEATVDQSAYGSLTVTFATGEVAEGAYHPMVMTAIETGGACTPATAFHRVTSGSPTFVNFDISSRFNADVVVNGDADGLDDTQDPIGLTDSAGVAFVTRSVADLLSEEPESSTVPALPDDGLVDPLQLAGLLEGEGAPVLDVPECLPPIQFGWSNDEDGDNAWMPETPDSALNFDVPPARYAEVMLFVTNGAFGGPLAPETVAPGLSVTFHYEGGTSDTADVAMPPLGMPLILPPSYVAPLVRPPSFTAWMSATVPVDDPAGANGFAGISALMLTPDSTKTLSSVSVSVLAPAETASRVAVQAVGDIPVSVLGAAGLAVGQADLSITKERVGGAPVVVGDEITYRLTVTNEGSITSTPVTVSDPLPSRLTYVSATTAGGSCGYAGGTVTCSMGTLAAGASETIDIVASVNSPGTIANTATASMEGGEIDSSDNAFTATATATAAPVAVPSLSAWGLMLLAAAMVAAAATRLRA